MIGRDCGTTCVIPADDKRRVLQDFRRFFRQGMQYRHFTRCLHGHLTRRCEFMSYGSRRGFYQVYFEDPEGVLRFLDQFDRATGCVSAELGTTCWLSGEHADVDNAMVDAVRGMIPAYRNYAERKLAEHRPVRLCA